MNQSRRPTRLLIFSPNWLGDAVMALPAIATVARALPDTAIHVAARSSVAPLFTMVDRIASVLTFGNRRASVRDIERGSYDTALLFTNSVNTAWIARRAGIAERWGYRNDFRSWLLTRAVTQPSRLHQTEYYRRLVQELGYDGPEVLPHVEAPADRQAAASTLLSDAGWDVRTPLVAVAPGAAFGGAKRWPARSFAAVIDGLASEGVRCVLIGSAADRQAGNEVIAALTRGDVSPLDLIGRTDLPMLAGVLVHCRALVSNDSGAMHFAAALGVPVTAMFGPTRERETSPIGIARHTVLTHNVWCRPCMLRECPLTHRCMTAISVESVLAATRASL